MTRSSKRLTIAIALTIVDVAACNYYCGVIWQVFARDFFAKGVMLGLLSFWMASAIVIWLHVAHDFRHTLRKRDARLRIQIAKTPIEVGRDTNV